MLSILHDASVPIEVIPAPHKLNKHRMRAGKPPIPMITRALTEDYVSIIRSGVRRPKRDHQGGTHASPIAHWRRAHHRHYASGKVAKIPEMKVNWRDGAELHRLLYRVDPKRKS